MVLCVMDWFGLQLHGKVWYGWSLGSNIPKELPDDTIVSCIREKNEDIDALMKKGHEMEIFLLQVTVQCDNQDENQVKI